MSAQKINNAVIIVLNTENYKRFDMIYGGESLLNRTLIALSKSGIENAKIICNPGKAGLIVKQIAKIRHRIKISWEISEKQPGEYLSDQIKRVTSAWKDAFLLLESDTIWHPTAIKQVVPDSEDRSPIIYAHKNVYYKDGKTGFSRDFKEKYKIQFQNADTCDKIIMKEGTENISGQGDNLVSITGRSLSGNGLISAGIIVCHKNHFDSMSSLDSLSDIVDNWIALKILRAGFISEAWWLKITAGTRPEQIREFFWRVAFKEISGEFSKLVNSRLSKPMTFLFVKLGFSPNAISILEIILFLIASLFLFVPDYWGMVVFALIWQFSAGVLDRCDGEVARLRNYESPAGGRFDMLIDDLRFAIPLAVLGVVCYLENPVSYLYPMALTAIMLWYIPAALYQQIFMYRHGYVSIQAMGVDYFKAHEKEIPREGWQHKIRPFLKGDIRTFYVFLLSFTGYKPAVFWVLFTYELVVGITYYLTVKGMRKVVENQSGKN